MQPRGLNITNPNANVTINNLRFSYLKPSDKCDGGAIINNGILTLNHCSFNYCFSNRTGGAIYSVSKLNVYNCEFNYCTGENGGSISSCTSQRTNIINSTFKGTTTYYVPTNGGAIYNQYGDLYVDNCIFTKCYAIKGAGIYTTGEGYSYTVIVNNSNFINNSHKPIYNEYTHYDIEGISICSLSGDVLEIYNSYFTDGINSIYATGSSKRTSIVSNSSFYGAGIDIGGNLILENLTGRYYVFCTPNTTTVINTPDIDAQYRGSIDLNTTYWKEVINRTYNTTTNNTPINNDTNNTLIINNTNTTNNTNATPVNPNNNTNTTNTTNNDIIITKINVSNFNKIYGTEDKFIGTFTDNNGNPLIGQHINIRLSRTTNNQYKDYDVVTDYKGEFNLPINLAPGTYYATVDFNGLIHNNKTYLPTPSNKVNITVNKENTNDNRTESIITLDEFNEPYGAGKSLTGHLTTINNKNIIGRHVGILLTRISSGATKTYDTVTDYTGSFNLAINLARGQYRVIAGYNGDMSFTNTLKSMVFTIY